MQIRLLGAVSASLDGGETLDVGPAKCQALLAALGFSVGSAVPVARLVELVWGTEPPRTAEKTLQSYVARLRESLGAETVVRVGNAYLLNLDTEAVDVGRFQARFEAGDTSGALSEWRGEPLAGLDAPGLDPIVTGLTEQWLNAVETDLERSVESNPGAVIAHLTQLTDTHPFREGLWALLMTALYATGRQADALGAYGRARRHLVDELGVEPGPRLRGLEASILSQDRELHHRTGDASVPGVIPTGTVTFAFSEVEGSTKLWVARRYEAAGAIARHEEIVHNTADKNRGHIFVSAGDSFGVAFDRVSDAADWAVDLQSALETEPWPGIAIAVRIGIHTGEAEERSGNYFGPAVNAAHQIVSGGHNGQVLVSGISAALLPGRDLKELGALQLDGVRGEQAVHQLGPGEYPPFRSGDQPGNLPRSQGQLFGRADLLQAVTGVLETASVVTLVGPGGIGKTRLALDAARLASGDVNGSVWLVELADVATSGDVTRAVADALQVTEIPGRSLAESVLMSLKARPVLLVLDNCEHVVDGAADLATALTTGSPSVRVLATSREGLGIAGEQLIAVGPLDAAGAGVALFEERARALDRTFDAVAHRNAIEEICERLDGVPLAIELAAARTLTLSPADLVERLDDAFRLLTGGRRKSVERHRTLRATIRWSYDLLSPDHQLLLSRLSVFAGSFDLEAVENVAPDDEIGVAEISGLLGGLVERSLVLADSGPYGRRFRLLEIMRQFGGEQLAELGGNQAIASRHAQYVIFEVARARDLLVGRDEIEGAGRLDELWPNLRAAVDWACANDDVATATALIGPIATQTFVRRGTGEIADWAERVLAMADPDDNETLALGLLWIALHHVMTHDRAAYARIEGRYGPSDHVVARAAHFAVLDDAEEMITHLPPAIAVLRQGGNDHVAALFEVFLGGALLSVGDLTEAVGHLDELADRFRTDGPPTFLNWVLFMQASAADFAPDHQLAEALYEASRAVQVPPRTNSPNDVLESRAAFRRGDHTEAFEILGANVDELLDVGNMSAAGLLSLEFVNMMAGTDRLHEAGRILGYLDHSGILDGQGRGFRSLVAEASEQVDADVASAATRRKITVSDIGDDWAMTAMSAIKETLDELLHQNATPPRLARDRPR